MTNRPFDAEAFAKQLRKAKDDTKPSQKEEDAHLQTIEMWTIGLGVLGLALASRGVWSPLAMIMAPARGHCHSAERCYQESPPIFANLGNYRNNILCFLHF